MKRPFTLVLCAMLFARADASGNRCGRQRGRGRSKRHRLRRRRLREGREVRQGQQGRQEFRVHTESRDGALRRVPDHPVPVFLPPVQSEGRDQAVHRLDPVSRRTEHHHEGWLLPGEVGSRHDSRRSTGCSPAGTPAGSRRQAARGPAGKLPALLSLSALKRFTPNLHGLCAPSRRRAVASPPRSRK